MKHLKLISMFILGGLVLTGCAVKSPTTAMLEHKEKKVNQTIVQNGIKNYLKIKI